MKKIISIVLMVLVLMGAFTCIAGATHEDSEYLQSLDLGTPKVTSVRNGDYGVYITFTKIEHATRYNVYMKVKGGSWQPFNYVVMEETDDKMVVLDQMNVGKKAGTTYYYTVKAFVSKGDATRESKYDKVGKSIKYIQAPYPSNVYNNHSGNKVSWGKSNGADGYYLYRKTPSTSYKKIATIKKGSTTSYLDKNIKSGQKYTYTVKAYKGKLVSSYYKNGVTISNAEKVNSPVITTKNVTGGKRVYISSGNEQDVIFYKIGKDGTYKQYTRDFGLTSTKTIYAYVARTKCYKSATVSKKVVVTKAKAPAISVSNCVGGVKITLKTTTPNATLYYKTSKDGSYIKYTEPFLLSSTKTIYAKASSKGYVTSPTASKKISVSKVATPTLSSAKVDNEYSNVALKWKPVSGAQGYYIYRADELDSTYILIDAIYGAKASSYVDYDCIEGLKNTYKIRAYCSGKATSAFSNTKSAYTVASNDYGLVEDALTAYQKAAKEITETGNVGYTQKAWHFLDNYAAVKGDFSDPLWNLLTSFMVKEHEAEEKICAPDSEEAKLLMPISNCSTASVESVTVDELGSNYIVRIVMKDQRNPQKTDTDGLNVMSKNLLYLEDLKDTAKNDPDVSSFVTKLKRGYVFYDSYTITAVITPDGKFESISHECLATINAVGSCAVAGDIEATAQIKFFTQFKSFKY